MGMRNPVIPLYLADLMCLVSRWRWARKGRADGPREVRGGRAAEGVPGVRNRSR